MKFLRNPFVVTALIVVGVAGLFLAFWPTISRMRSRKAPAPATGVAAADVSAAAGVAGASGTATGEPLDKVYLAARFGDWVQSPSRDPFELYPRQQPTERKKQQMTADQVLKLQAVWRQTGGNVAVINAAIVSEGDSVGGYKVQRIEADRVFVIGEIGSERIEFANPGAPAPAARPKTPGNVPEIL